MPHLAIATILENSNEKLRPSLLITLLMWVSHEKEPISYPESSGFQTCIKVGSVDAGEGGGWGKLWDVKKKVAIEGNWLPT